MDTEAPTKTITISTWRERGKRVYGLTWDNEDVPHLILKKSDSDDAYAAALAEAEDEVTYSTTPLHVKIVTETADNNPFALQEMHNDVHDHVPNRRWRVPQGQGWRPAVRRATRGGRGGRAHRPRLPANPVGTGTRPV